MLVRMDDYIINLVQNIYDYIWDCTGITKGMIGMIRRFFSALLIFTAYDIEGIAWRLFFVAYYIFTAYNSYSKVHVPQKKGQYKKLNNEALNSRKGRMQTTKLYIMFPCLGVLALYLLNLGSYTYATVIIFDSLATYLITIIIRDRNPTEFSFSFNGAS